jgi:hypothetical protein
MTTAAIIYAGLAAIPFVLAAHRYRATGVIRMPANDNRRDWT